MPLILYEILCVSFQLQTWRGSNLLVYIRQPYRSLNIYLNKNVLSKKNNNYNILKMPGNEGIFHSYNFILWSPVHNRATLFHHLNTFLLTHYTTTYTKPNI
jgi:hypothetical protein